MGYGEYGGNGSVHWLNDADDIDEIAGQEGKGEWPQHGIDYHGKKATPGDFTIRVKLPEDEEERAKWIDGMKRKVAAAEDILEFTLPIQESEQPHAQIQVSWGKTRAWQDNLSRLPPGYQRPAQST
jgi:hypothetical protein